MIPHDSISLRKLEDVLRQETGCVAAEDVPCLLRVIYAAVGIALPSRIAEEIEEEEEEPHDSDDAHLSTFDHLARGGTFDHLARGGA